MSRNIILINENIPYIRRRDLENEYIATIWIEVKLKSKKNILVMGGYRQWRLFKELGIIDSNKTKNQIDRFKKIIEQWSNAIKEGKDVIVVMDTNIDTQTNSNHNTTNRIKPLHDILQQHLNTYNITQHNNNLLTTHYTKNQVVLITFFQMCQTKL